MKKVTKNIKKKVVNTAPKEINVEIKNKKSAKTIKDLSKSKYQYKGHFPSRSWPKQQENEKGPKV